MDLSREYNRILVTEINEYPKERVFIAVICGNLMRKFFIF